MSAIRSEMLQIVAQTLDLPKLDSDSLDELLPEIELRIRQVIQDALQFQYHSKRRVLSTKDINQALQARHVEPLYGFQPSVPQCPPPHFQSCSGNPDIYFHKEHEFKLQDLLECVLPPIPRTPSIKMHWLAIDGIQPEIPENENANKDNKLDFMTCIESEEFTQHNVEQKPLMKHVLTEEMRLYYSKLTKAIKQGTDIESMRAAFQSVANNPGMRQLLPYISRFVYEEVKQSQRNLAIMISMVRVCRCLFANAHLRIELYLHQLLPALLTCVLGKELCEDPTEDHWSLRDEAAQLIANICRQYGEVYEKLQARISKTYDLAISDLQAPFPTQYGAIQGLLYLGPLVMESLLFPKLQAYCERLDRSLSPTNPNIIERLEAQNCLGVVAHACGVYFCSQSFGLESKPSSSKVTDPLMQVLGERLVPYMSLSLQKGSVHTSSFSMLNVTL